MYEEKVVSSRPDRDLFKKLVTPGDYNAVPYEDTRCKVFVTGVSCSKGQETCEIEPESRIFNSKFNGDVEIGDCDGFIDKDFELILQQMCCGEISDIRMVYRDGNNELVKEIKCTVELNSFIGDHELMSDWEWKRFYNLAQYHKEKGVNLVNNKRIPDAFRRFHKALKMVCAIDPNVPLDSIDEITFTAVNELKVNLYNNLAYCQLQYNEYAAALELCNDALLSNANSIKALYRRCIAYTHLQMYEEAWMDIQKVLQLDPNNKAAQHRVNELKVKLEKTNKNYKSVIKNMFK